MQNPIKQYYTPLNWTLWSLMLAFLIFETTVLQHPSVSGFYYTAGNNWLHSKDLYSHSGWGFIYFPQAALLYSPLAELPYVISETLWRIILTATLAGSLWQFSQSSSYPKPSFTLFLTLGSIFVAMGALKLGQMNALLAALILFCIPSIKQQRWWLTACLLSLAFALKPTAIVFAALFGVLYRPLYWRLPPLLLAFAALPFVTQTPDYALKQYSDCFNNFKPMISSTHANGHWSDLFSLLFNLAHIQFSKAALYVLRALAAIATWLACIGIKRHFDKSTSIVFIYTLAGAYLMLFNPRTENNGYIVVLPALLWFAYAFYHTYQRHFMAGLTAIMIALMTFNHSLSHTFDISNNIIRPLMSVLFLIQLAWLCIIRTNKPG